MSTISAGTTTTTGYVVTSDTTGALVLKTGASGTTAVTVGSDQSVTFAGSQTFSGGTANGVLYLNGSKVVTSGSALTFNGTQLGIVNGAGSAILKLDGSSAPEIDFYSSGVIKSYIYAPSTSLQLNTVGANPIIFLPNEVEGMRLTSTGLGIGTSSPAYKLHIVNDTSATNTAVDVLALTQSSTGTAASGLGAGILFNSERPSGGVIIKRGAIYGVSGADPDDDGALAFYTLSDTGPSGFSEKMRLDSSGNLGLGVTPSAWDSTWRALDVDTRTAIISAGNKTSIFANNAYFNSGWKYKASQFAGSYAISTTTGNHEWSTAPSGTAGNAITFTQAMTLDASGNLMVGTTTAVEKVTVNGRVQCQWNAYVNGGNTSYSGDASGLVTGSSAGMWAARSDSALLFSIGSTERARINSGGNLIVGNSSVFPSPALINVVTATGLACGFAFSDNTASARGRLWWGGSDGISLFNTDNSPLRFGTTNAERARITDAGNFGIGISSPQYRLSLGNTVGRKLAIYDDGSSGGVAAGFGTDLSGSPYELSAWAGSPGGGNGVFTWGQVNTTNGAFAERMRIDTSGNLLVGMGSFSSGGIEKTIAVNGNSSAGFQIARSGAVAAYIYSYGSAGFRVETTSSYARVEFVPGGSGGVQLASAGATSWTSLSDERTKTDLVPITDAVQKVSSLRAVTGRFIKDEPEISRSFLIAQDFVDVFPQAVSTFKEKDDDTEYLGLAYTDTIPLLVAAIKEQQALIESLTQRIAALEGQ